MKLRRGDGIHPKLYTEMFHLNIMYGIRECGGGVSILIRKLKGSMQPAIREGYVLVVSGEAFREKKWSRGAWHTQERGSCF